MLKRLKSFGFFLIILSIVILTSMVLILISYGLGWLLMRLLPFTQFEATLLSMIALIALFALAGTLLHLAETNAAPREFLPDEMDADEDQEGRSEEYGEPLVVYLPQKRRARGQKDGDIAVTDPDARCACGSGRKYKNCHGRDGAEKAR